MEKTKPETRRYFAEDMQKKGLLTFLDPKLTRRAGIAVAVAYWVMGGPLCCFPNPKSIELEINSMLGEKHQKRLKSLLNRLVWALAKAQKDGISADAPIAVGDDLHASVVPFSITDLRSVVVIGRGGLKSCLKKNL
ncbi:MAG: hypothetical protein ABIJ26_01445 [Candidatus Margulisiibacteriota bacterium]